MSLLLYGRGSMVTNVTHMITRLLLLYSVKGTITMICHTCDIRQCKLAASQWDTLLINMIEFVKTPCTDASSGIYVGMEKTQSI